MNYYIVDGKRTTATEELDGYNTTCKKCRCRGELTYNAKVNDAVCGNCGNWQNETDEKFADEIAEVSESEAV